MKVYIVIPDGPKQEYRISEQEREIPRIYITKK